MRGLTLCSCLFALSCTSLDPDAWQSESFLEIPIDRDYHKPLLQQSPAERAAGMARSGPLLAGLDSATEVWSVTQSWDAVTPEAGLAWGEHSGLTWSEKYAAWVDAMEQADSLDGDLTIGLITPWGHELPSPRLECAEMGLFLRALFASWHGLPFFVTAWHPDVGSIHYGHFGIVDHEGGRITGSPTFALSYGDHSADFEGIAEEKAREFWPHDEALAARYLTTAKDDHNPFLGDAAYAGAYFDEIVLNKRVGHFLLRLLTNFGSIHLASSDNTYDIAPRAMAEGDLLIERWQRQGIGHVTVLKEVEQLGPDRYEAELIFGSMPRIQPVWYDGGLSRAYFTSQYSGGPDESPEGVPFASLGGGLKRWRTPVQADGRWTNVVAPADVGDFIPYTDLQTLGARVPTFRALLGDLTIEEQFELLGQRIDTARTNLTKRPASCANRQRREEAFAELYDLAEREQGLTRAQVDETWRTLEDYIFAELAYESSKTCCWNSTTPQMHQLVVDYNLQLLATADERGECVEPEVFKSHDDGYARFAAYAAAQGRADEWKAWSEDEPCPQRDTPEDVVLPLEHTAWCALPQAEVESAPSDVPVEGAPCGEYDYDGACLGDTLVYCEDEALVVMDCTEWQTTCGWNDDFAFYTCL